MRRYPSTIDHWASSFSITPLTMSTAVSAPGKVLLAGGYLVLDREYTGLVFGLSARIHVLVHDVESKPGVELSEILVESPQFQDAVWNYGYSPTEEQGGVGVVQLEGYDRLLFLFEILDLVDCFSSSPLFLVFLMSRATPFGLSILYGWTCPYIAIISLIYYIL